MRWFCQVHHPEFFASLLALCVRCWCVMEEIPCVDYDPEKDGPDLTFVLASGLHGPPMPWPGQTAVERADSLRDAGFGWDGRRLPVLIPQNK